MRFCLVFLIVIGSFSARSQEIKKKYLGVYSGEIPSYALELGEEVFQVQSATIEVHLQAGGVFVEKITSQDKKGTYQLIKEDKEGMYLEIHLEGQFIPESYILYKKDKRLERKGIYPQPDVFLKRI